MKGQVKNVDYTKQLKDIDYKRVSEYEKNFKFKKKLQKEPRFGNCSIIQNPKTNQLIVVKEKRANDKKEAARLIMNARKLKNHRHPNILNLLDYSVKKHSELCSSFFIIKYFYEYPKSDLNREMKLRGRNAKGFSDVELTHLLYQQMHANEYLETQNMHHGDVRPLNISYDPKRVHSQLIDQSDSQPSARRTKDLQRNRLQNGNNIYQSPKMYSNLMKKNLNFQVDPNKEDVYANGLSLLEAGNGKSIQDIYDKKKGEVDQEALNRHLNEFRNKHGVDNTLLASSLESMLANDEAERPNFRELKANLPPYEEIKPFLDDRTNNPNAFQYKNKNNDNQYNDNQFNDNQFNDNQFNDNQFNAPNVNKAPVVVNNAPKFEMYEPEREVVEFAPRNDIPLKNPPKTFVHAEIPMLNPPQNVPIHAEPPVKNEYVEPVKVLYNEAPRVNQNYTTEIKHEYRKGNQVLEPKVIREDRSSIMPYNNSSYTYNDSTLSTNYGGTTNTDTLRYTDYRQPTTHVVNSKPEDNYYGRPQNNSYTQQPITTNVVYTNPQDNHSYRQPQDTGYRTHGTVIKNEEQFICGKTDGNSNVVYGQPQNNIRRSVVVTQNTDTSGLKLVNTYEDSSLAR